MRNLESNLRYKQDDIVRLEKQLNKEYIDKYPFRAFFLRVICAPSLPADLGIDWMKNDPSMTNMYIDQTIKKWNVVISPSGFIMECCEACILSGILNEYSGNTFKQACYVYHHDKASIRDHMLRRHNSKMT